MGLRPVTPTRWNCENEVSVGLSSAKYATVPVYNLLNLSQIERQLCIFCRPFFGGRWVTIFGVIFKWPKVGTGFENVRFEPIVLLSIVLNKCLAGLSEDRLPKSHAELIDAEKKFGRGISCERGGKFVKFDMAHPKVLIDCIL